MVVKRRDVRIKVMQVIYAHQMSKDPISKVKSDIIGTYDEVENIEFSDELINRVLENSEEFDGIISRKVNNWELDRIGVLERILIKMAISELLYFPEIPPKVSINEVIEISKMYCSRNTGRFINGILDSILDDLKKENKLNKRGRGLVDLPKSPIQVNTSPEKN